MSVVITTQGQDVVCDTCAMICNTDNQDSIKFLSGYITITQVHSQKVTHYCNDECMKKSKSRSPKATTKTNEE